MLSSPPVSTPQVPTISSGNSLVHSILSYDSNIMLAAIISLLLVILFVLLLHAYAKWFLVQAARRGGTRGGSVPLVLGARFHHHFHTFSVDTTFASSPTKGLEASVISSIPQFVYKTSEKNQQGLECVICLSVFENEEIGRILNKCEHAFHVDCIDMWLHSHTTCPTCRGPAICENKLGNASDEVLEEDRGSSEVELGEVEIVVVQDTIEDTDINVEPNDMSPGCSSSPVSSSHVSNSVGASLKRMMSRSKCVGKIHPSGNAVENTNEIEEQLP